MTLPLFALLARLLIRGSQVIKPARLDAFHSNVPNRPKLGLSTLALLHAEGDTVELYLQTVLHTRVHDTCYLLSNRLDGCLPVSVRHLESAPTPLAGLCGHPSAHTNQLGC